MVDSAPARAGDVVLARDERLGREGYRLEIGDRVTIAGGEAGVFYGTQTVLQILRATPGRCSDSGHENQRRKVAVRP